MVQFIDTNILLYSISRLPEEAIKRDIARGILDRNDCALSVQVLLEFYAQSTRKTRLGALTHSESTGLITAWRRFPVQPQTVELLDRALILRERYLISIWDSMIIAAAKALGCGQVLSEDMQHGQVIDGVKVVNPFGRPPE